MHLKLIISLALCHAACARPRQRPAAGGAGAGGLQEALHNLQLLHQLVGEEPLRVPTPSKTSKNKSRKPKVAPPGAPLAPPARLDAPQNIYSADGPFSDIPSDAFRLDQRKEFRVKDKNRSRVAKKDLSEHAQAHAQLVDADRGPDLLMRTCLDYFRGRSHPDRSSLELILDICSELVDDGGVEEFALDDDDEKHHKIYDFRANGDGTHHHHSLGPGVAVECEYCPSGHHVMKVLGPAFASAPALDEKDDDDDDEDDDDADDDREDVRSDVLLNDLLQLFKPIGHYRRDWRVLNSQNPNQNMRQYVEVKK